MPKSSTFAWPSTRDEQVVGRDVAVHDAQRRAVEVGQLVRGVQPRERVGQHAQLHRQREAALLAAHDHLRQRLAVEVLHHQHRRAVDLDDLVGLDDVRVVQARGEPRLAEEHLRKSLSLARLLRSTLTTTSLVKPLGPSATAR